MRAGLPLALPQERRVDLEGVRFRPAPDEREVFLFDAPRHHLLAKFAGGRAMFGDEREAAGFAVEPVDDRDLPAIDDFVGKQLAQFIPERPFAVRFARMHFHERAACPRRSSRRFPRRH